MARLPYVDPEAAAAPVASALAKLPPLNLFRMIAQAETAFRPWLRFGGALLGELELDPALRELAILRIARLCDSEYEWSQHAVIAVEVGVAADAVAALRRDDLRTFDERERAVLDFTDEAVEAGRAGPTTLTRLGDFLPPREVVELLLVISHYTGIARITETLAIEPDPPAHLDAVRPARPAT